MHDFYKFPSTPHLAWLGKTPIRADKIMSPDEVKSFLKHPVSIEEKVDGANLGISLSPDGDWLLQNRGSWLAPAYAGQWKRLPIWLISREGQFQRFLKPGLILFGEWCYARHSVEYSRLPSYFIGFDVYDQEGGYFYSVARRNELCKLLSLPTVPQIMPDQPIDSLEDLKGLLDRRSAFGDKNIEGVYLRYEQEYRLVSRAKLVAPDFTQSIRTHWSKSHITLNEIVYPCS